MFSIIGVIAAAAIAIGVNLFADARLVGAHLDLTKGGLYTLSDGTKKILAGLKEPITLRLFYSRRLGATVPVYGGYSDQVREMLQRYAQVAGGKLRLEFYDPEPFSDTEDRALAYGLQGVPVDQSGTQIYFGLAGTNLQDDERTIPFFQTERQRFLEFDLTKLVFELSNPKRPVVGVMSSLPLDGDPRMMMMTQGRGPGGQPYASTMLLRQTNSVRTIPPEAQIIDADVEVLLLAHAAILPETTLYAIDQFVMRGGRLMAMVDPWSEAAAAQPTQPGMPVFDASSNLKRLFDTWGIEFDTTKVVGDLTGAWRVRAGPEERNQAVNYVAWFNIRDGVNHNDPATVDLGQIGVASAGALRKAANATIEFTPLLTSSNRSAMIPVEQVKQPRPSQILADFKPDGETRVIAARVRGALKSAFDGPPPVVEGQTRAEGMPAHRAATDGAANMVIVADSDLLADRFWVRVSDFFGQSQAMPFADNGPFLANLIGTLAGGDALIGLRSRGDTNRPFTMVQAMQSDAEARFRQTEQALTKRLEETEQKLRTLRTGAGEGAADRGRAEAVITAEQRAAIDEARKEIVDTRRQLRAVQLELNRDIAQLDTLLKIANIALVPAILTVLALVIAVVRRGRRSAARA
jgi:ABC-type uncharacterized transport system involved in gliding motility auxiliary subunit